MGIITDMITGKNRQTTSQENIENNSNELNFEIIEKGAATKGNVLSGGGRINQNLGGKQVSSKHAILKYSLKGKKKKKKISHFKEFKINRHHLDNVINSGAFPRELINQVVDIFTLKFLLDWRFFAQVEGLVVNDNNYGNSKKYGNNDNIMQSFYEPPTLTTTTTRSTTLDAAAAFSLAAFHMNTSTFHRSTSTLQMTTSTQSTVSSDKQSIPPTRLITEQSWKSHSYPPE